uniref:Uncharacterized protein n=1 Tax=Candidatus Methanogaster sp. ANME-2c ERB4 TaxID=2759911 RepID=A0A7G9Y830_9EURY|nr:hypothetical protein JBGFHJDC_00001 [Methanosarcinales archaeon ANME-2c ERB4]QNO46540.1 hypothetical protein CODBBMEJ_00001 [Methanosarcinales archaeon ANME-2c ERB4]
MHAVFVVLLGKCDKSGVDSLVWDFHYIPTRGVGCAWWAESMDITGFLDSAVTTTEINRFLDGADDVRPHRMH